MLVSDRIALVSASGELRVPGDKLLTCSKCVSFKLTRMIVFLLELEALSNHLSQPPFSLWDRQC